MADDVPTFAQGLKLIRAERIDARRERIATAVLAGFAAAPDTGDTGGRILARDAVEWADYLIEQLDMGNA